MLNDEGMIEPTAQQFLSLVDDNRGRGGQGEPKLNGLLSSPRRIECLQPIEAKLVRLRRNEYPTRRSF